MITFTSSFARFLSRQTRKAGLRVSLLAAAPALLASAAPDRNVGADKAVPSPTPAQQVTSDKVPVAAINKPAAPLRTTMLGNFDRATRGISGPRIAMATMPSETSSGIDCSPSLLTRSAPRFRITLPRRLLDRKKVFAAITPNGYLRVIYWAYGNGVETVDIIVPSRTVDWESARKRNVFRVDARYFDALDPDETKSRLLFREAGLYQLALINVTDRTLLEYPRSPFRLIAGCVVHWQP